MRVVRRWPFRRPVRYSHAQAGRRRVSSMIRATVNSCVCIFLLFSFGVYSCSRLRPFSPFLGHLSLRRRLPKSTDCLFYTIYSAYPPRRLRQTRYPYPAASSSSNGRSERVLTFISSSPPYTHWTSHPHCALLRFFHRARSGANTKAYYPPCLSLCTSSFLSACALTTK